MDTYTASCGCIVEVRIGQGSGDYGYGGEYVATYEVKVVEIITACAKHGGDRP